MITKRVGMLKDWLARAVFHEDQGVYRIHGFVNSMGAASNRMTHNSPNVAQVPAPKSPYGKECRSLFTVRPGYKLVAADASGLELRCLANYMKDQAYADSIVHGKQSEGTDIHSVNQRAAGLPTRDLAKTFVYGVLYGAGDAKVGSIIGGKAKDGKAMKKKFFDATPALKELKDKIKDITDRRSWVIGADGRILRVRSPHSALNLYLQSAGAIYMKYWLIEVMKQIDSRGLEAYPVANIHDEAEFEVKVGQEDEVAGILEKAFEVVTKDLNLFCPLAGEAQIGNTWYDVH